MFGMRLSTEPDRRRPDMAAERVREVRTDWRVEGGGPLDDELIDLYGAILIVVPMAFLLKLLWL
ncbi:MAG: hypothetical protein JSR90_15980 [Proteobacteria bacterium]|nr:hypothetical protein [Pseudomonadota bacterium]